ncbi:Kiwa anti-phage protein KwaB-like domain-containing protein [Duganella sp. HH105]|uniref:Kiwa anti-phage protein KwaB-like domain-containing protein n=1 Tax=Duganella sp. HH105 TaxID=1781067 RepID=UPI0008933A8F|nr:Kiwa anti-phage protein KwaB-like domain-containing protein [Duganella sp. HH105]OEZ60478.1 hypothetical protein DUGA6_32090 [Duganella sp. HH105]
MPSSLETLQEFDIQNAEIKVWTFKKTQYTGVATPTYNCRWVNSSDELDQAIRNALISERDRISEVLDYSILAQNNEGSALSIQFDETHAALILEKIGDEIDEKKVKNLKEINNSAFYVIKIVDQNGNKIFAARKTDDSWRAKKLAGVISAIFSDDGLDLNEERSFNISNHVDFFIVNDEILISSKQNFESILSYKQAHVEDFRELTAEENFSEIFSETDTIKEYVGENKIRLRRALAIKQKGHYKNPIFMGNLRNNFSDFGLLLEFDAGDKLIVTLETCGDVFTALLDHRLTSPFSENIYDVQDTASVNV